MSASSSSSQSSKSSSSDISTSGKLIKLVDDGKDRNNFGEWKIQTEIDLLSWDLLKYVTGPLSKPPDIPSLRKPTTLRGVDDGGQEKLFQIAGNAEQRQKLLEDAQPWMIKNNIALSKISKSISGPQKYIIRGLHYASQAWDALIEHYQTSNAAKATALTSDIHACRCSSSTDVGEWLKQIQSLYNDLTDLDPNGLPDRDFAIITINNLPQTAEWRSFATGLRQRVNAYDHNKPNRIPITSKEFLTAIRNEAYFIAKNLLDSSPQVFSADSKGSKRPRSSDNTSSSSTPKRTRTSNNKTCSNPNCGRNGHDISECVAYGGANVGNYGPRWRGPWNLHLPPFQRSKANNCPPPTHPAFHRVAASRAAAQAAAQVAAVQANAIHAPQPNIVPYYPAIPALPQTQSNPAFPQASALTYHPMPPSYPIPSYTYPPSGSYSTSGGVSDSTNPTPFSPSVNHLQVSQPFILATRITDEPFVASLDIFSDSTPKSDHCFYDSAANSHVFHDRTAFETYESIPPIAVKGFGEDLSVAAIGRGTVRLEGKHNNRIFPIILTNVLHIPRARVHLISGGEFTERNVIATIQRPVSFFSFRGIIFLEALFEHGFYRINARIIRPVPSLHPRMDQPLVATSAASQQPGFYTASWGT